MQQRLDEADERQRERYPHQRGQSRSQCYPGLQHSGRPYSPEWEEGNWGLERAEALLAEVVVARRVDATGCVSLYSRNVSVGRSWSGTTAYVRYDPPAHRWLFSDANNHLLQLREAPELSRERIRALTATDARSKRE